jgi:hypothetical protein
MAGKKIAFCIFFLFWSFCAFLSNKESSKRNKALVGGSPCQKNVTKS